MDYQVAQKFHACTDPHTKEHPNYRVRDIVDLHLVRTSFYRESNELASLGKACQDLFASRAREAKKSGFIPSRSWPPVIVAYSHWKRDFENLAKEVKLERSLEEVVKLLNGWIAEINRRTS
jgi:hypothetical protein